jgi:O-antigen/teichoic acid export membrane protein
LQYAVYPLLLGWLRIAVSVAAGLITVPMLIDRLSDRYYGLWVAIQDIANLSFVAIGGMGAFFIREMVHFSSRSTEIGAVSEKAFGVQFFLGGIASSALGLLLWIFLSSVQLPADQQIAPLESVSLCGIVALNIWRAFCIEPLSACLRANLRWGTLSAVQVVHLITRSALLFWLIHRGDSLLKLAIVVAVVDSLFAIILYRTVNTSFPGFRLNPIFPSYSYLAKSVSYGLNASFLLTFVSLFFYLDTIIIAYTLGPTVLSYASIPQQITLYFVMLSSVFGEILFVHLTRTNWFTERANSKALAPKPAVETSLKRGGVQSEESQAVDVATSDSASEHAFFRMGFHYSLMLGVIGAILMLLAGPFVKLWIGKDVFVQAAESMIIPMVAISMVLTLSHQIPISYLLARRRIQRISVVLVAELLVKCILATTAILVWGIWGLFAANLLVTLLLNTLLVGLLVSMGHHLPWNRQFIHILLPCMVSSILTYWFGRSFCIPDTATLPLLWGIF